MEPADPGLKRLAQVAVVCRNIEKTAARWAALLSVDVPAVVTTPPGLRTRMVYQGAPSDARAKLAFIHLENITIELIEPLGGDSSWQEGLDRNGESIHHVAFNVVDLDATLAHFSRQGFGTIHRGRYGGDDGTYVYLDTAPALGATVELLHSDPPRS